jgi:hypothetical protein
VSDSILEMVKGGPILVRRLRGRSAAFQLKYARLLHEGQIVEHGLGTRQDPIYVGLPGAKFPPRKMTVRLADICLLVLAGATEKEARLTLTAIATQGEEAVAKVCEEASNRLLDMGLNPVAEVRRAVNRRGNGKPIQSPHDEFDIYNQPLVVDAF